MLLGTSFSHRYIRDYFSLAIKPAFQVLLALKLDLVRVGCYWQETESINGQFDFSQIKNLLVMAEKAGQNIILTIGMKALRWPEFYLPKWSNYKQACQNPERLFLFLRKAVNFVQRFNCVKYLQIENEPLDQSGPKNLTVPFSLLKQEVELVRDLSKLPIVLTLWGNRSLTDDRLSLLSKLADIIGMDFYCQIPDGRGGYWGPTDLVKEIKRTLKTITNPVWITELQTNPWKEASGLSPEKIMAKNLQFAKKLPVEAILFWGYEYRYSKLKSLLNWKEAF